MPTTTRAAVLWGHHEDWKIEEVELDDPGHGEVLVKTSYAGMCHSDEHVVQGDMPVPHFPFIGGHEGSGVVEAVGPGVDTVAPGDHVAMSFVPSCGRCKWCAKGQQNLCDLGAKLFDLQMITREPGSVSHRLGDTEAARFAQVGSFAEHMLLSQDSLVKIEEDLPLDVAALVSCGVATGWGSAVYRANVTAGDTVAVIGVGGVGINAVQGAAMAGAKRVIAVDPVEFKREKAMELGATHTFASMEEAFPAVTEMTWGQMADKVIMTPGVLYGNMMQLGTALAGKGGTIVVTAIAPITQTEASVNLFELAMWNKEIKGTIFGSLNPRHDIPALLGLYREGQLKLDELITRRYTLDEINEGYQAMRDGENIRGIIVY